MLTRSSDLISISLTDETLKIVQLRGSGTSVKVVEASVQDIKGISEAELPKIVQKSLQGFSARSSNVVYVLPGNMITTKNIEIPSTNPEEIKSIVNLQAGRHTPYSREEIQVGFINIGTYKTTYSRVLLVIANRNTIRKQLEILEKAGLKVKKVLFGPEGIAGFYHQALNLQASETTTGIIDIGQQTTDFVIMKRGLAIASRNIPVGRAQLSLEGATAVEKLIDELSKTIESYQSEDIESLPERYILTVNDDMSQAIIESLHNKLKWNVEAVPYIDHVKIAGGILNHLATDLANQSLLDIIASAAHIENMRINFMPEEVQLQKSIEAQGREIFKTAVLAFSILILVAATFALKMYFRNTYLTRLTNDYKENRKEVTSLENRSTKIKIIQNFLDNRMTSLDVISELYRNVPNEIYITAISMDNEGNISVQGISDVGSLVYNLNSTLKNSKLFKSADVKSKTAKKDRGKDVHAFEIVLKLKSNLDSGSQADNKKTGKVEAARAEGKL